MRGWLCCAVFCAAACTGSGRGTAELEGRGRTDEVGGGGGLGEDDHVAPTASIAAPPSLVRGGTNLLIAVSAADEVGIAEARIDIVKPGGTISQAIAFEPSALTLMQDVTLAVPAVEAPAAFLRLVVRDFAGHEAIADSSAFAIDSTPPDPPAVSLASGDATNVPEARLVPELCGAATHLLVNEGGTPEESDPGWIPCSGGGEIAVPLAGDGVHVLQVFSRDGVGWISSPVIFTVLLDTVHPVITLDTPLNVHKGAGNGVTITWSAADDRALDLLPITVQLSNDGGQSFAPLAAPIAVDGDYLWTITQSDGDTYVLRVVARDAVGNEGTAQAPLIIDSVAPTVDTAELNGGAPYTGTPLTLMLASVSDAWSRNIRVRLREAFNASAPCNYADDGWYPAQATSAPTPLRTSVQSLSFLVSATDADKKVCVWARDDAGNTSTTTVEVPGANYDIIRLETGSPPKVTAFSVSNGTAGMNYGTRVYVPGNEVSISWTASDAEGLAAQPVSLLYTKDNVTWQTLVANLPEPPLSGGPTGYTDSYTGFVAPTGSFRVRITARDRAGNTSVPIDSDVQTEAGDLERWSIYAGNADNGIGGSAKSTLLPSACMAQQFAIDPTTNDIYALSVTDGLLRLDAATGLVEQVIRGYGYFTASTLPDEGVLSESSRMGAGSLAFDSKGRLYMMECYDIYGGRMYQIDTKTKYVRWITGDGTTNGDGAVSARQVKSASPTFALDAAGSVYFFATCDPANPIPEGTGPRTPLRLLKTTIDPDDGTLGTLSILAGKCDGSPATPLPGPGPYPALTTVLGTASVAWIGGLGVIGNGDAVYIGLAYQTYVHKLIGGQLYLTNIPFDWSGLTYDAISGRLLVTSGAVRSYIPHLGAGQPGDEAATETVLVASTGTGACNVDGVPGPSACVTATTGIATTALGTVVFSDGPMVNSPRPYRVRYIDPSGAIQTFMGTFPFYGDGLHRTLVRGDFGAIHYKNSATGTFPAGLYFMGYTGPVFGHFDASSGATTIDWGNQQAREVWHAAGTTVSSGHDLGLSYGLDGLVMAFGQDGLPVLRYSGRLVKLDADHKVVVWQNGSTMWFQATDTTLAMNTQAYWDGGRSNLAIVGEGAIFFGGWRYGGPLEWERPRMTRMNFATNATIPIMGRWDQTDLDIDMPDDPSADITSVQSLITVPFADECHTGGCPMQYSPSDDRIYFIERNTLRYITAATSPTNVHELHTVVLTLPSTPPEIDNFILSQPDASKLFYTLEGTLRCHLISGSETWCDDSDLGPFLPLPSIVSTPNQLTWRDDTHLLVSTGRYVLEYSFPPP